jgi:outer membrane scaffolding protein for murein synthesis (MipA/OmpV family)
VTVATAFLRLGSALPLSLLLVVGLACLAPVLADEKKGFNGYLNLGGVMVPDYEGSSDYRPAPLAVGKLGYDEFYLELRGPELRANIMPAGLLPLGLELGPSLAYRFGRSDVENDRVDAMHDIDGTVAAGGFVKLYADTVLQARDQIGVEIEALSGVGSNGDGTTVSFGPFYSFWPWDQLRLGIRISATYASGKYNETHFGIDAADAARSGFTTYDADGGMKDVGLSINATYRLTEHWGIAALAGITRLVGDAADSPIVEDAGDATQGFVGAGLVYNF